METLFDLVRERSAGLEPEVRALVVAAFRGDEEVERALAGDAVRRDTDAGATRAAPSQAAYLTGVEIEGFRGIAEPVRLELDPGPGLVVVTGRNGSGKSSLAEGVETLLRGTCPRWEDRPTAWRKGWRNLHHDGPRRVAATFAVEGFERPVVVERTWAPDVESVADGRLAVRCGDDELTGLDALGWDDALTTWRPFLAYGDLATLLEDRPSAAYDRMSEVLGLEALTDASDRLGRFKLARRRVARAHDDARRDLLVRLGASDDPRALACATALTATPPRLDEARRVAVGVSDATRGEISRRAELRVPERDAVDRVVRAIRDGADHLERLQGGRAERSHDLAELLERAVALVDDDACPVCERPGLDASWVARARERIEDARLLAREATGARRELASAVRTARDLVGSVPLDVLGDDLAGPWRAVVGIVADGDPRMIASSLEDNLSPLLDRVAHLRDAARAQYAAREEAWRPLAGEVLAWIADADAGQRAASDTNRLERAERWLDEAHEDLRSERFAPLADEARTVWQQLRQESNVTQLDIGLAGRANRRRLEMRVSVDDASAPSALGVMSQGELNALALSLFVPRMRRDDSPFRFVVVDDPVQSMDPQKVDGLARVLADLGRSRQVVVFTHDARLLEAIRRLALPARTLRVQRRSRSQVTLEECGDPVTQYLDDAVRVLGVQEAVGDEMVRRVVPGLCREALEAALTRRIRRDLLGAGRPHHEVEQEIADARGLRALAALALLGDRQEVSRVDEALSRVRQNATQVFRTLNQGAHGDYDDDAKQLVRHTRRLAIRLLEDR